MQNQIIYKPLLSGIFLVLTLGAGVILHKQGRPYGTGVFTLHKLSSLALFFFIVKSWLNYHRAGGLEALAIAVLLTTALSLLILLVSGGVMSQEKMHGLLLWAHRVCTAIFVVCVLIFLLLIRTFR